MPFWPARPWLLACVDGVCLSLRRRCPIAGAGRTARLTVCRVPRPSMSHLRDYYRTSACLTWRPPLLRDHGVSLDTKPLGGRGYVLSIAGYTVPIGRGWRVDYLGRRTPTSVPFYPRSQMLTGTRPRPNAASCHFTHFSPQLHHWPSPLLLHSPIHPFIYPGLFSNSAIHMLVYSSL